MTAPTRYEVTDYKSPTDPRRMALLRDSIVDRYLTVATEDEARDLIAQLTAWLDAPRLAARETAEVVVEVEGFRLLRTTAGEWAVRWPCDDDDEIDWDTEVVARQNFKDITGIDTTGGGQ